MLRAETLILTITRVAPLLGEVEVYSIGKYMKLAKITQYGLATRPSQVNPLELTDTFYIQRRRAITKDGESDLPEGEVTIPERKNIVALLFRKREEDTMTDNDNSND